MKKTFLIVLLVASSHSAFAGLRFGLGKSVAETGRDVVQADVSTRPVTQPRGGRVLAMDILDTTASSDFSNNVTLAKAAGAEAMTFQVPWSFVESTGTHSCAVGTYVDPYSGALGILNAVLPMSGVKLSLTVDPLTTNIWTLPSIYSASDFTADPTLAGTQNTMDEMACRFNNMLDFVLAQLPNVNVVSLQIGNEIDAAPESSNANFWTNYARFYRQVAAHAKTIRTTAVTSALPIGVVGTAYGLSGVNGSTQKNGMKSLNDAISDDVVFTYYPIDSNFSVKDPSVVRAEIATLLSVSTKTFRANEVGYPSGSSFTGSSEARQATFYSNWFQVWDTYRDRISYACVVRLNDLSHSAAQNLANSYTAPSAAPGAFVEFLETLGLRTFDGQSKSAYQQIKSETSRRSW